MKKRLVTLLFATMLLSLVACGKNENHNDSSKNHNNSEISSDDTKNNVSKNDDSEIDESTKTDSDKKGDDEKKDISDSKNDSISNNTSSAYKEEYAELASTIITTQSFCDKTYAELVTNASTQYELNNLTGSLYYTWDDALNATWSCIKTTLPSAEYNTLLTEQQKWISKKEKAITDAGLEAEGGSMQTMLENDEAFELTRSRCYELLGYLGPNFSYELVKAYGFEKGESKLSFYTDAGSVTDAGDYYLVDITVSRPVKISDKFEKDFYYSFCVDEIAGTYENVQYDGNFLLGEDGTEYYYTPQGTDDLVELFCDSDDRVDSVFYKGQFKIDKDAIYTVNIEGSDRKIDEHTFDDNVYFNGAKFNDNGVITQMISYGD